jgi:tetratricopeptide (TPR) repeat protein/tRNA A-37 threonylcarbamoyl transferase component Bud32
MNPVLWRRIREVFAEAHRLPSGARSAYLDSACSGDNELRKEVASLVAALEKADDVFQPIPHSLISTASNEETPGRLIGTLLGSYRIVRQIGSGGMGEVYEAIRDDGRFQRRVAVKFIRSTLARGEMIRRFEAERSLLAALQHPNIAQLIDAGTTDDGLPYLIMEYVDGVRIDEFCDVHQLSIAERLRLFRVVCAAVQFAHQRLVVHRDIKPGNILVTVDGSPKLLDFGIAKLLREDGAPGEKTQTGLEFMTPDYASPEQLRGEHATTVSDVYALGMLLYKLLTGQKPYEFRSALPFDMSQTILNAEPTRPSVKAVTITVAGTPAARVRRALSGDVDAIVLMALRKEPDRRYRAAQDISDDIGRYLEHHPVTARRGEARYRAGKFIRRHRTASIAMVFVALTLIGGVGGVVWQAEQAQRERDIARIEVTKAKRINEFLQQMIAESDFHWYNHGKGPGTTAIDILNAASDRLENDLQDEPEVKAELHRTIGNTYLALGKSEKAVHHFAASLLLRQASSAAKNHELMESEYYLAGAYLQLSSSVDAAADSAEFHYRRVIDNLSRTPERGDVYLPYAYQDFAGMLVREQRLAEAESSIVRALPLFLERYGEYHFATAGCYGLLGQVAELSSDSARAEGYYRRAFDDVTKMEDRSVSCVLESLEPLARSLVNRGALDEAEALTKRWLTSAVPPAPYEQALLSRLLCCSARIQTLRGDLEGAGATLSRATARLEGLPESEIKRMNARQVIAVETGRLLIRRKSYAQAREVLARARSGKKGTWDIFDRVSASCDVLLGTIPRAAQGAERVSRSG